MKISLKLISLIFILTSCDKDKYIKTYSLPKLQVIDEISFDEKKDDTLFSWEVPVNWIEKEPSSMRLASFDIPYGDSMADISITNFSGDGGGIEQNVNRWRRQLNLLPEKIENLNPKILNNPFLGDIYIFHEINSIDYKSIIGAIIPQKNQTIFIKINTSDSMSNERKYELELFCLSLSFDEKQNLLWNAPKNWIQKKPSSNLNIAYFEINSSDEN